MEDLLNENEAYMEETIADKLNRVLQIKQTLENVKPLYEELDRLTIELMRETTSNPVFAGEYVFTIVDNFQEKNTVFRPLGVKRFELKVETAQEHQESLVKALKKAEKAKK